MSKQIAQLEARLGHLLFVRGTRCLTLTPAAERLLPFVREGLARMGRGSAPCRPCPTSRRSASRCPPAPAAGCCGGCRRSRGGGGGAWQPQPWHRLLPGALRSRHRLPALPGRYPHSQPLFRERLTPVCAPAFAAKHRLFERDLNELPLLPLIHASADRRDWRNWFAAFLDIPGSPRGQLFDTLDLAMNAALQGFGLSRGSHHSGRGAGERRPGRPFAPVLETDHEYALLARPDSQRHGVQRVCHWLLGGRVIPEGTRNETAPRAGLLSW